MTLHPRRTLVVRSATLLVVSLIALSAKAIGCGGDAEVDGVARGCETTDDCLSGFPYLPGTVCRDNRCVCRIEGFQSCCDEPEPKPCDLNCRPVEECVWRESAPFGLPSADAGLGGAGGSGAGGGGGGSGGGGGDGGILQKECQTAADCAGPPDKRCGSATCTNGVCGLEIKVGPLESQIRGDCVTVVCDAWGNANDTLDPGDFYNDGKQCTLDFCDGKARVNQDYPDGLPCPEAMGGVCFGGACVACFEDAHCPVVGDVCDGVHCVPFDCEFNQKCGVGCAPCPPKYGPCASGADCVEGVCAGNKCAIPSCNDGVQNDGETGVDCGSASCGLCGDGKGCATSMDCASHVCWTGKCQAPACNDGVMNGDEVGIDCGGSMCGPCAP